MKILRNGTALMAVLGTTLAAWAQETILNVDSREYEQALKGYAAGSLTRPDELKLETDSLLKLFQPRNRGFGSLDLVTLLEGGAAELKKLYPDSERVQVGDTSQKQGGSISGHGSHQNGLDADLVYMRVDRRENSPQATNGFTESFVSGSRVTPNFDVERNWKLISIFVSSGRVGRIFVDPVIKKTFCDYAKAQGVLAESTEILRAMRPWPNHDDHMHVRLTCPAASPQCTPQTPPPAGNGCDEVKDLNRLPTPDPAELGC